MGVLKDDTLIQKCRKSRKLVLVIVAIALFLDNMLLTTVVPIIPELLYEIEQKSHSNEYTSSEVLQNHSIQSKIVLSQTHLNNLSNGCNCAEKREEMVTNSDRRSDISFNKGKRLANENVEVGVMFASKAFVQLITNPFVGPLTNRIGYSIPMFFGFIIMFVSTIIFAFGGSYTVLFIARALQGIGSSCSSIAGMGMLAERYPDDQERGNAMGIALGGLAMGVLIGPPFGSFMLEFVGKTMPFIVLAMLATLDGMLQLTLLQPSINKISDTAPSLFELLRDPYIIICAGAITIANTGIAMLEPTLPIYMTDHMNAEEWQLGAIFLPASISYLIGTNIFGPLGHRIGRWVATLIGLIIISACLFIIPLVRSISDLIIPNAGLGFAIGMVDSSMMPQLGYIVDIRHAAVYGTVYAIGDVAFCLGFAVGPALSGFIVNTFGFNWMLYFISLLTLLYAPLLIYSRNPTSLQQENSNDEIATSTVRYVAYNNSYEYYP